MHPDCPDEQTLLDFAAGTLAPPRAATVEQHLESCDACVAVLASADEPGPARAAPDDVTREAEGRYELQRELGEGAEGRVWLAWDHHLGRAVALKLAHRDGDRPLREARLVARLNHPGIVTVFEIGRRADGSLYSAQRLVRAERGPGSLREAFARTTTLEERLRLVPRLLQACEAVGHAHARGVVHRDLKPEHVALGDDGETVVIDWGLAVHRDDVEARGVVGTPGYRSPEQEAGAAVGPAADVYSLGVMLAEALEVAPPPLRPPPLVAIAQHAMRADPAQRYATASALAEDLTAWLSGGVVRAHDYALSELARRAFRRHRVALALLGVVAVVSFAAAVSIAQSRSQARGALATTLLQKAELAQAAGGWDEAALYGAAARELADLEPARLMLAATAGRSTLSAKQTVWAGEPLTALAWSPTTHALAVGAARGQLVVWSAGRAPRALAGHRNAVSALVFSPDGARLYSAGEDRRLLEWDLATGAARELRLASVELKSLALGPNGAWLAVGDELGALEVLELPSGTTRARWQAHGVPLYALAVAPGGAWLATGAWNGEIRLWTPEGAELARLDGHQDAITGLAASPDGALLASSSRDRSTRVWRTGQPATAPLILSGHAQRVAGVAWLDARHLQSAGDDGQVRSWALFAKDGGVAEWQCLDTEQLGGPVTALAVVDGATIAGTEEGALLRVERPRVLELKLPWRERLSHLDADDAGLLLVEEHGFVHRDPVTGALRDRDPSTRTASQALPLSGARRLWIRFGGGGESAVVLREADGGDVELERAPRLWSLLVDREERWVGALGNRTEVTLHALDGGAGLVLRGHESTVFGAELGKTLAVTGSFDGTVGITALPSGERLHTLRGHWQGVRAVALSQDERRVASGSWDKTVRLWDARSGALEATLRGHQAWVSAVAFSPSGRRLASASWDGALVVWDVEGRVPLLRLEQVENEPRTLRWDGEAALLVGGTRFTRLELEVGATSLRSLERERGLTLDGVTPRRADFGGAVLR